MAIMRLDKINVTYLANVSVSNILAATQYLVSSLAAYVLQCLLSEAFERRLSLVLFQPNPKCLGSYRVLTPVSNVSVSEKCLDSITE